VTYTLTTVFADHGFCTFEVRTLETRRDGCRETVSRQTPAGERTTSRSLDRDSGARVLRTWRRWAATCPDQELDRG
jgi:hypothetical protein